MASSSLDFKGERAQIAWTISNQTLLCCLFRFFHRDSEAFRKVFAVFFKKDLQHFSGDVPFPRLSTQWYHLKYHGDPVWHKVHIEIPFPPQGRWLAFVSQIKERATSVGVSLVEKEEDDIDTTKFHLNPSRQRQEKPTLPKTPSQSQTHPQTMGTPASVRTVETQSSLPSQLVTVTNPEEPICTAGGKVCYWCSQEKTGTDDENQQEKNEDIPSLLYRWSNVESQGVNTKTLILSGLFSTTEQEFFLPKDIPQSEFDQYVTNHVRITKSVSPFISTFKSLLAPIHRALRAREGAIIHIIDSSELQVYSAKSLVRDLNINIRGYRGVGEYLVWGRIPTPAIVCSFTASSLVRIVEKDKELGQLLQLGHIESSQRNRGKLHKTLSQGPGRADYRSGFAIGRLLENLNLQNSHTESIAMSLFYSWRFSKQGTHEDYLKGVKDGYTMPTTVPAAPGTPTSLCQPDDIVNGQEEPFATFEEDWDDTLSMSEEDDDIVSTIESPCPATRNQPGPPRVEFFDPRAQRWSENATERSMEEQNSAPEHPIKQDDGEVEHWVMDLDVVIDELMNLAE